MLPRLPSRLFPSFDAFMQLGCDCGCTLLHFGNVPSICEPSSVAHRYLALSFVIFFFGEHCLAGWCPPEGPFPICKILIDCAAVDARLVANFLSPSALGLAR
jgi:hypothetical protein